MSVVKATSPAISLAPSAAGVAPKMKPGKAEPSSSTSVARVRWGCVVVFSDMVYAFFAS